jgi:hypothetical protein
MESLLKQVPLTQDVTRVLDEIRAGAENALYGVESDKSEELFAKHVVSLVEGAGLPVLQVMHYRWFLRELSRLWRTRKGRDLAFHLELCIRKWVELGLEPRTLQFLVCEAHERLKAANLNTAKACPARSYGGGATRTAPQDEISRQARNDEAARGVERDAKGPDSDTRILESSSPGILPDDSSSPGVLQ